MDKIEAVLFDLDGTLLDIDFPELMREYLGGLAPVVADLLDVSPREAVDLVIQGTETMQSAHPGQTNKEAFDAYLLYRTGVNINEPAPEKVLSTFYREVFPTFRAGHGPFADTCRVVETCLALDLPIGIATQPVFPEVATRARMRWAGLDTFDLPIVSTYETFSWTKPYPEYFLSMARRLDVDPARCLMVGDDAVLDMAAADVGMTTFYVGGDEAARFHHRGTLGDLSSLLGQLTRR